MNTFKMKHKVFEYVSFKSIRISNNFFRSKKLHLQQENDLAIITAL